jgi:hypothetical protein
MGGGEQTCMACGKEFECGMGGLHPCWCSTDFAAVMPLPKAANGCYCRECLARLIASAQERRGTT